MDANYANSFLNGSLITGRSAFESAVGNQSSGGVTQEQLQSEIDDRIVADNVLQQQINVIPSGDLTNYYNKAQVDSLIDQEEIARQSADQILQNQIDALPTPYVQLPLNEIQQSKPISNDLRLDTSVFYVRARDSEALDDASFGTGNQLPTVMQKRVVTAQELSTAAFNQTVELIDYVDDQIAQIHVTTTNLTVDSDLDYRGTFDVLADDPTQNQQVATKNYVDIVAGGSQVQIYQQTVNPMANSTVYTITHGLNASLYNLNFDYICTFVSATSGWQIGDVIRDSAGSYERNISDTTMSGLILRQISTTQIQIITGTRMNLAVTPAGVQLGGSNAISWSSVSLSLIISPKTQFISSSVNLSSVIPNADYSLNSFKMSSTAPTFTGNQYITKAFADTLYLGGGVVNLNAVPTPIANYSFGGFKLTNLGTPTVSTDSTTKLYVDTRVTNEIANSLATYQPERIRSSTNPLVQLTCTNSLIDASNNVIRNVALASGLNGSDVVNVQFLQNFVSSGSTGLTSSNTISKLGFNLPVQNSGRNIFFDSGSNAASLIIGNHYKMNLGSANWTINQALDDSVVNPVLQIAGMNAATVFDVKFGDTTSTTLCNFGEELSNTFDNQKHVLCNTNLYMKGKGQRAYKFVLEDTDAPHTYPVVATVGIVTDGAVQYGLYTDGWIRCTTLVQTNPSSVEYKEEITDFTLSIDDFQPKTFQYKSTAPVPDYEKKKLQSGFIFEQVDERYQMVENDVKRLDYSKLHTDLLYSLINEVKQLKRQVAELMAQ